MNKGQNNRHAGYREAALFEQRFWLQVLGDHRFMLNGLSPIETEEIQWASYFIYVFDQLLEQVRANLTNPELLYVHQQAYQYSQQIREFKLHLLRRHLTGEITFGWQGKNTTT
ncbi:DUF2935 domain-containing protein [Effusibacillus dendaii]|uniref:DUF2935 domain-containing protein n=1 Tax=Effusibacillus dendaii TaxID=2743772 RepID=A0A7I8DEL0_9BACL|nr:DUF2935 domain-containing protein [Effusibacillus dendaii]BCJ86980.1 hypothetical protein skT53_19650 [Effusibacillus dendaii]